MKTIFTQNGPALYVDDEQYEKIKDYAIYYDAFHRRFMYREYNTGHYNGSRALLPFFFGHAKNRAYLFRDGQTNNFCFDNVIVTTRDVAYRHRPPIGGHKYKGAQRTRKKCLSGWLAQVWFSGRHMVILYADSELHAARLYNAMLGYYKIDGYRNKVPEILLTDEQKAKLDRHAWKLTCKQ